MSKEKVKNKARSTLLPVAVCSLFATTQAQSEPALSLQEIQANKIAAQASIEKFIKDAMYSNRSVCPEQLFVAIQNGTVQLRCANKNKMNLQKGAELARKLKAVAPFLFNTNMYAWVVKIKAKEAKDPSEKIMKKLAEIKKEFGAQQSEFTDNDLALLGGAIRYYIQQVWQSGEQTTYGTTQTTFGIKFKKGEDVSTIK